MKTHQPDKPVLYTVDEAANLLRISRDGVYRLIDRKELISGLIGARRLIPAKAIDDYLSSIGLNGVSIQEGRDE